MISSLSYPEIFNKFTREFSFLLTYRKQKKGGRGRVEPLRDKWLLFSPEMK